MKLHNTLTRQTEEFTPQKPGEVTLYTCGPTVYDYAQIGNLRAFLFDDILRRTLEVSGYHIKHVMNITDVGHLVSDGDEGEDKLEKGARRTGKTAWDVAAEYTEVFKQDMAALNVLPPSVNPKRAKNLEAHDPYARATDFIPEQLDMVKRLIDHEYAYQTQQAIYFDVAKLPDYGLLTGQKLAEKAVGARDNVVTDPDKKSPHDFAVWFFTVGRFAGHSMHWPSPWGDGFPGWHLECSAIIHTTLGDPIDIHTGGVDHIGTHHPNEMAQTEGAFGHHLANTWMHNEFILVNGTKMSKSKQNFYTLKDVVERGFHPLALRLLYLQAHYRSELNFTWESLAAAQTRLLSYRAMAALQFQPNPNAKGGSNDSEIDYFWQGIQEHLQNDLNTVEALAMLSSLEAVLSKYGVEHNSTNQFADTLRKIDDLLGLDLSSEDDITPTQKRLISQRETARETKDWAAADKLRDQLAAENIAIEDTSFGPRWRRTKL